MLILCSHKRRSSLMKQVKILWKVVKNEAQMNTIPTQSVIFVKNVRTAIDFTAKRNINWHDVLWTWLLAGAQKAFNMCLFRCFSSLFPHLFSISFDYLFFQIICNFFCCWCSFWNAIYLGRMWMHRSWYFIAKSIKSRTYASARRVQRVTKYVWQP